MGIVHNTWRGVHKIAYTWFSFLYIIEKYRTVCIQAIYPSTR